MSDLLHEYDAMKRREYYLRTRKLVGRSRGSAQPSPKERPSAAVMPAKKTRGRRRKELEARVNRLKARLERLQEVLRALVEAAQARSGVDDNSAEETESKTSNPASPSTEEKTQQEKDEAAEAAQEYRDKNKELEAQVLDLNNKIKAIHERIKRLRREADQSQTDRPSSPRSKPIQFVDRALTNDRLRRGRLTTQ